MQVHLRGCKCLKGIGVEITLMGFTESRLWKCTQGGGDMWFRGIGVEITFMGLYARAFKVYHCIRKQGPIIGLR